MTHHNPLFRRGGIGKTGRVAEKEVMKRVGGRLTPASGAVSRKGDVTLDTPKRKIMLELKSTITKTLSLDSDWLRKVSHEASINGDTPALMINFVTESGVVKKDGSWVMIPEWLFKEIMEIE